MERQFTLPIAIAAAIHAGLLFGYRPSSVASHVDALRKSVTKHFEPPPVVQLETRDDPATTDSTPAKSSSEVERPSLPELPPPENPSGPVMEMPRSNPTNALSPAKFDLRPPGLLNGSKLGAGIGAGLAGVRDLDNPPRARLQTAPQYPFEARNSGREGTVTVEFTVDENGLVTDPHVVSSSDRVFEEPTLRAVSKWRFEPGRRGGRVVRFRMALPVVFNLNQD